jgi:hypothetical protein
MKSGRGYDMLYFFAGNQQAIGPGEEVMGDFWAFRKMITPVIIEILFWVGVIICVIVGIILIVMGIKQTGNQTLLPGVLLVIFGPLAVRLYCEVLIVFFRINETLTEIKHLLEVRGTDSKERL